jgi:chromosome segregation ATPase
MSRVSDTRLRTREAAARLVSTGRRPHELTVDSIYAEIKQGSRTTINDELKLWKDEQAKADALTAALPPAVANAMLNIWAVAVEHGEKVFDQGREELETQLVQATLRIESLESEKNRQDQRIEGLQADVARGQSELGALRELLSTERTAKEAAVSRANALEQQLESVKTDAAQATSTLKAEQRQRVEELQATIATQERSFRQEIDKATERLEGVQKHVMLQVTEAREAQKRAEAQLSKASQKNEQLLAEAQQIRRQIASLTQTSERAQTDLAQAHGEMNRLRSERETLIQQVATASGKLGALGEQIESLERRAIGAETRLEDALKRPAAAKRKAEKPHQQDLISR